MSLTKEQMRDYDEKGFVVLRNYYTKECIINIGLWLDELELKHPREDEEAKYYEISEISGEHILIRVENINLVDNQEIMNTLINAKAIDCLTQLFEEPPILFKEKINYKLPGCRADKLHQDQAAGWNNYSDYFISMGIIIDKNRKENAALSFMHSGNYKKSLMCKEWEPLTLEDPPYHPADEYILLEADPGDVIFFNSYVPHGSPPNNSNKKRRNIFFTFNKESDGDMRAKYYMDKFKVYPPNNVNSARSENSYRV